MYEVIAWYDENRQETVASGLRDLNCAIGYADSAYDRNRDSIVSVITPNGFTKYEVSEFGVQYR
jgi:hypothetical protein